MSLFIVLAENLCLILKWQTVYSTPVPIARHISPYPIPSARGGPRFSGDRATCLALLTLDAESSRIMQANVVKSRT